MNWLQSIQCLHIVLTGRKKGLILIIWRQNCKIHTYIFKQTWKRLGYCWLVTIFLTLCQDEMICVFSCITQNWAASWWGWGGGSQLLLDVFSVSDAWPRPPSHKQKKNHTFALVRRRVMLLIPTGLQASIQSTWKRNKDSIRRCWQIEVTRSKKSFHELECRMHTCIFFFFPNEHIVEVLLRERSFSTGGRRVGLGFSLMAQFSCWDTKSLPLLLVFFVHNFQHADTDTMTTAVNGTVWPSETTQGQCSFCLCVVVSSCMLGFRVQSSTFVHHSINWHHRSTL